jgi:para-nitrobenzyl esterase
VVDGRWRAFHCSEIAFVFANSDVRQALTCGGNDARALWARVRDAWIQFVQINVGIGYLNHSNLPMWDPVTGDKVATMHLRNTCEMKINADADELRIAL